MASRSHQRPRRHAPNRAERQTSPSSSQCASGAASRRRTPRLVARGARKKGEPSAGALFPLDQAQLPGPGYCHFDPRRYSADSTDVRLPAQGKSANRLGAAEKVARLSCPRAEADSAKPVRAWDVASRRKQPCVELHSTWAFMGPEDEPAARNWRSWSGRVDQAHVATGLNAVSVEQTAVAPSTKEPTDDHDPSHYPDQSLSFTSRVSRSVIVLTKRRFALLKLRV